jgi:hypothetical protein
MSKLLTASWGKRTFVCYAHKVESEQGRTIKEKKNDIRKECHSLLWRALEGIRYAKIFTLAAYKQA